MLSGEAAGTRRVAPAAPLLESLAADRLAGFAGFLRANGYAVGGGDAVPVLISARQVGLLDPALLRWSLRALLCGRADEWRRFDDLFDAWFLPANRWQRPQQRDGALAAEQGAAATSRGDRAADDPGDDGARPRSAASREELLGRTDFSHLAAREHVLEIEALMRRLARRLVPVEVRRRAASRQGRRVDLPRTIRRSVARGGTPVDLAWRARRRIRPRLVLLIDVSRSMALHSFFYLRLARALAAEWPDVASFIFHTRVMAVSQALHDVDPWRAQERLHWLAQGFGGGTRIGDSLVQFVREHAARTVHARTAVLIFSDGYDTGEPAVLADALAALRRRARRVVWLNPLAGLPGWAPLGQGLQAALPHVDLHAAAPDLASLEAVLPRLVAALR